MSLRNEINKYKESALQRELKKQGRKRTSKKFEADFFSSSKFEKNLKRKIYRERKKNIYETSEILETYQTEGLKTPATIRQAAAKKLPKILRSMPYQNETMFGSFVGDLEDIAANNNIQYFEVKNTLEGYSVESSSLAGALYDNRKKTSYLLRTNYRVNVYLEQYDNSPSPHKMEIEIIDIWES